VFVEKGVPLNQRSSSLRGSIMAISLLAAVAQALDADGMASLLAPLLEEHPAANAAL
jgi:hypothetical protein